MFDYSFISGLGVLAVIAYAALIVLAIWALIALIRFLGAGRRAAIFYVEQGLLDRELRAIDDAPDDGPVGGGASPTSPPSASPSGPPTTPASGPPAA